MRCLLSFPIALVPLLYFSLFQVAYAYPVAPQAVLKPEHTLNNATCDSVTLYTTEWFLSHTLPAYRHELHHTALFYTRGTSAQARSLSASNPRAETQRTFYENMSRAFARMARASATVMHDIGDWEDPPKEGIWGRVELPALAGGTNVMEIRKINKDLDKTTINAVARDGWEKATALVQRAMDEVRAIFRAARTQNMDDATGDACSIWNWKDDVYLDSLW